MFQLIRNSGLTASLLRTYGTVTFGTVTVPYGTVPVIRKSAVERIKIMLFSRLSKCLHTAGNTHITKYINDRLGAKGVVLPLGKG
jgi:hypothetical protein